MSSKALDRHLKQNKIDLLTDWAWYNFNDFSLVLYANTPLYVGIPMHIFQNTRRSPKVAFMCTAASIALVQGRFAEK